MWQFAPRLHCGEASRSTAPLHFHHVLKPARGLPGLHASIDVTHIQLAYEDLTARIAPACARGGMRINNVEGCCIFHPGLWLSGPVACCPGAAHGRAVHASSSPAGCGSAGSGASRRMQRCKVPPQLAAEAETLSAAVLVSLSNEALAPRQAAPVKGLVFLLRLTAPGGSLYNCLLPCWCPCTLFGQCQCWLPPCQASQAARWLQYSSTMFGSAQLLVCSNGTWVFLSCLSLLKDAANLWPSSV